MSEPSRPSEIKPPEPDLYIKRHGKVAWIATAATLATYFGLMIAVSLAPSTLTQPISPGSAMTNGIVLGAAIIVFLIVVAAVFTRWNNKLDENS